MNKKNLFFSALIILLCGSCWIRSSHNTYKKMVDVQSSQMEDIKSGMEDKKLDIPEQMIKACIETFQDSEISMIIKNNKFELWIFIRYLFYKKNFETFVTFVTLGDRSKFLVGLVLWHALATQSIRNNFELELVQQLYQALCKHNKILNHEKYQREIEACDILFSVNNLQSNKQENKKETVKALLLKFLAIEKNGLNHCSSACLYFLEETFKNECWDEYCESDDELIEIQRIRAVIEVYQNSIIDFKKN